MSKGFPNMAGKPDIDDALAAELEAAGIEVYRFPLNKDRKSEVSTSIIGSLHGWKFERAWYYWRANGPGIEVAAAERLHAAHGKEVRVAGHCGCPSPTEWHKGLAVGDYHVDTPTGLKALADTIRGIVSRTAPSHEAVALVIREQLTEQWHDAENARSWSEDVLLTGCRNVGGGKGYQKPEDAAAKLANDAAAAVLSFLEARS